MNAPDLHDDILPIPCAVCRQVSDRTIGELLKEETLRCAVCGGATKIDASQVREFMQAQKNGAPRAR